MSTAKPWPPQPERRGVPRSFSLDQDAATLLRALCPNSRGQGLMMSELIRREAERRAERPKLLAELAAQVEGE